MHLYALRRHCFYIGIKADRLDKAMPMGRPSQKVIINLICWWWRAATPRRRQHARKKKSFAVFLTPDIIMHIHRNSNVHNLRDTVVLSASTEYQWRTALPLSFIIILLSVFWFLLIFLSFSIFYEVRVLLLWMIILSIWRDKGTSCVRVHGRELRPFPSGRNLQLTVWSSVVSSISWSGSTSILFFFFLEMHSGWVGCDLRPLVPIICLDLVILFYFILLQRWEWCTISWNLTISR